MGYRDPSPTQGTAALELSSFITQHLRLCRAALQGRNPIPEGTEAKVQHGALCPEEGVVSMPSGRAVSLLIYRMCACVAKQRGSVNISSANLVMICFVVRTSSARLAAEGAVLWSSTRSSTGDF